MKATLLDVREIAPNVRHFVFEAPEVRELSFTPGQFVSLTHNVDGREITRPYSIASKPDGNCFDLCLNLVEDGILSPWLFSLEPGAEIETTAPLGYFVIRNPERDAVFVATGTGIAPMRSMLEAALDCGDTRQLTLLFGVRDGRKSPDLKRVGFPGGDRRRLLRGRCGGFGRSDRDFARRGGGVARVSRTSRAHRRALRAASVRQAPRGAALSDRRSCALHARRHDRVSGPDRSSGEDSRFPRGTGGDRIGAKATSLGKTMRNRVLRSSIWRKTPGRLCYACGMTHLLQEGREIMPRSECRHNREANRWHYFGPLFSNLLR